MGPGPSVFNQHASRHNGVHFFDSSIPKSGPNIRHFVHFEFKTWLAPQRRVLREWCVFYILASMQFLISHPARWLRTRRFSEAVFRLPGIIKHWKKSVLRLPVTFSPTLISFLVTLSLWFFLVWFFSEMLLHLFISRNFSFQIYFDNIVGHTTSLSYLHLYPHFCWLNQPFLIPWQSMAAFSMASMALFQNGLGGHQELLPGAENEGGDSACLWVWFQVELGDTTENRPSASYGFAKR